MFDVDVGRRETPRPPLLLHPLLTSVEEGAVQMVRENRCEGRLERVVVEAIPIWLAPIRLLTTKIIPATFLHQHHHNNDRRLNNSCSHPRRRDEASLNPTR